MKALSIIMIIFLLFCFTGCTQNNRSDNGISINEKLETLRGIRKEKNWMELEQHLKMIKYGIMERINCHNITNLY